MQTVEGSASIREPIVTGRALVIDDNASNLQLLKRMVERDGHVVAAVGPIV